MSRNNAKRARDRRHDAKRRANKPWRAWYGTAFWKRRREHQLATHPLCAHCEAEGTLTQATVANHVTAHRGDWDSFAKGALESLCEHHHNALVQSREALGYDPELGGDGLPLDPAHPFNGSQGGIK